MTDVSIYFRSYSKQLETGNDVSSVFFKVPNPGDCSFDTTDWATRCGWSQRQDDDADWMQANYRQNPSTGADADHQGTQTGKTGNSVSYNYYQILNYSPLISDYSFKKSHSCLICDCLI